MEKAIFRILILVLLLTSNFIFSQETYNYSGQVKYQVTNEPMSNVIVQLSTLEGTLLQSVLTDNYGIYTFEDIPDGTYKINFTTEEPAGGIELSDAYLIEQYLAGNYSFSDIQKLAADVNGNGVINNGDRQQIINGYLNEGNPFPIGEWVFETDTVTILGSSGDGSVNLGSSSGDVNGSLQPDPKRNRFVVDSDLVEQYCKAGDPIKFDLMNNEDLEFAGMHLAFRIPEGLIVTGIESEVPGIRTSIKEGLVKITWMDTNLTAYKLDAGSSIVTILAENTDPSVNDGLYHLALRDDSHFMDANGSLMSGFSLSLTDVNMILSGETTPIAYPNPCVKEVTVEFSMPETGTANVAVFDLSGRIVLETGNVYFEKGLQKNRFDLSDLHQGIYYYRINVTENSGRMITGTIVKSR